MPPGVAKEGDMEFEKLLDSLQESLIGWGPNILAAAAILVVGWFGSKIARSLVRRSLGRARVDETLVRFVSSITYVAAMILVVVATLGRLGVNTTSFAAVIAAAGLAVGLAFQSTLSNFAAGVLLIVLRPFRVGDYVEVAGVSGSVEEVQIFTTVLKTPDAKRVIVGNGAVMNSSITNYSANPERRVDMVFGIAYKEDIERARRIIARILSDHEAVLSDPEPKVAVLELADSSVKFAVRPWTKTPDYWTVYFEVTERIKTTFDAEGISIPFPQHDVHVVPAAAA